MFSTIAVGTDGSETADRAVEFALELAERFGARVLFLSAYTSTATAPAGARRARPGPNGCWRRPRTVRPSAGRVPERDV
jgi:nucleotide-binding universal stress UspA family protein